MNNRFKICNKCRIQYHPTGNNQKLCKICVNERNLCGCEKCGLYTKPGRKFIYGHNRRGIKQSLETIGKIRLALIGIKQSPECIEKKRLANTGQKRSPEACRNMEEAQKISANRPEVIENNKRTQNRPEVKEKKRLALTGKKRSEETKAIMGKAQKVAQNRPEVIKKRRLSQNKPENIEKFRIQAIKQLEDPHSNFGFHGGGKESYPEKLWREWLEICFHQTKGIHFFQNYPVGKYRLDFAWAKDKRCIEIDGGLHLKLEAIEHDRIRDEWLKSQGWTIVRIPAKDLKSLLSILWFK